MNKSLNIEQTWALLEAKLERNWRLNIEAIKRVNLDKARNKMKQLMWIKAITIAFYFFFMILFVSFTVTNIESIHLASTGIIFSIWTLAVCITSIHELHLITSIDYSGSIQEMQKRFSHIKLVIIRYLRLGVWVVPLYFGFIILIFKTILGIDIVEVGDPAWITANVIVSIVLFVPFAIWATLKLNPKNAEKKWMNKLLRGNGDQITYALEMIKEVNEFENEKE